MTRDENYLCKISKHRIVKPVSERRVGLCFSFLPQYVNGNCDDLKNGDY